MFCCVQNIGVVKVCVFVLLLYLCLLQYCCPPEKLSLFSLTLLFRCVIPWLQTIFRIGYKYLLYIFSHVYFVLAFKKSLDITLQCLTITEIPFLCYCFKVCFFVVCMVVNLNKFKIHIVSFCHLFIFIIKHLGKMYSLKYKIIFLNMQTCIVLKWQLYS